MRRASDRAMHNFVRRIDAALDLRLSQSGREHLGPKCNHADEQGNRHKGGGLFHDSTNHVALHIEHIENIVHVMFRSQQRALKQQMLHMEKLARFAPSI
jgi:hypothetical protein